jgi:hypothetical protein
MINEQSCVSAVPVAFVEWKWKLDLFHRDVRQTEIHRE